MDQVPLGTEVGLGPSNIAYAAEPMRHGGSCLLRIWSPEARYGARLHRKSAVKCC